MASLNQRRRRKEAEKNYQQVEGEVGEGSPEASLGGTRQEQENKKEQRHGQGQGGKTLIAPLGMILKSSETRRRPPASLMKQLLGPRARPAPSRGITIAHLQRMAQLE